MAWPAFVVGLCIIALAAPRFVSEIILLSARTRIVDIQSGKEAGEPGELAGMAAAIETAGDWTGDGRLIADGGLLLMRQAALTTNQAERLLLLRRALALTETGLRRSPAHPVGWTRLVALRFALGEPEKAAQALRLSLLTGPVVPQITASRLTQGLTLLPYLDPDTRQLLARQVRFLHSSQPQQLETLATTPAAAQFIQQALIRG
ncbi:hypothetical protein GE253_24300 [Niveispirillum sp. SYP-B3756]|uniref:hypothetical protein n=1 Tax=Niveispirillum sp. SYP-B3756 TaxID=2662178 RepID=UPI001290BC16|nr:hypothetical protein [Niveispirillum sp. SYP-B3756]MQP68445.1 hypothetical protein [Niveispirillum sp. SYP-B3756]